MNLAKLKKRYQQRRSPSVALNRVKQLSEQVAALPTEQGGGELLELSFADWCRSLRIKTDKGLQPFELFPWQESFADLILGEKPLTRRAIALLSSRQTGKTSLLLAIAAYLAQSRRQFTGLIIHRTTQDAHLLCRRLKSLLDGVELKSDSLSLLEFANSGSAIHFRSCNPKKSDGAESAGRGLNAVDLAVCDEFSHTSNGKEVLGVIAPTLTWSEMGIVCFVGTASSKQSYYYETLAAAAGGAEKLESTLKGVREGELDPYQVLDTGKGAVGIITSWRAIDRFRNEPNFLERVQNEFDLSDEQMDSEYSLIFGSSVSAAVFDFNLVMASQVEDIDPPKQYDLIFSGCDSAGQGKDYTVLLSLRVVKEGDGKEIYEVVDLYRKRTGTTEQHLNAITQRIGKLCPLALIIEKNATGQIWLENLAGLGFSGTRIQGFATTAASKPVLIGRLQIALERGVLRIPKGSIIIEELLAYRRTDSGKLEAGGKAHDDCVIALALALFSAHFNQ